MIHTETDVYEEIVVDVTAQLLARMSKAGLIQWQNDLEGSEDLQFLANKIEEAVEYCFKFTD